MSDTAYKTHAITFANKEDKAEAFAFLLSSKFPFKGVDVDTIVVQTGGRDALVEKNIKFD